MSNLQVVTGAGPVGWTVAEQLADAGYDVRVLTRTGSGPDHPRIQRLRVDVSDPAALAPALDGATAVFHCIHGSAYDARAWERELPAAEQVVMDAAQRVGAVVVFPESLYAYGRPDGPMTEAGPRDATTGKLGVRTHLLAARAAHSVPTVSVVASDFFGPHVLTAHAGERMVPSVLDGKTIRVMGRTDVPHIVHVRAGSGGGDDRGGARSGVVELGAARAHGAGRHATRDGGGVRGRAPRFRSRGWERCPGGCCGPSASRIVLPGTGRDAVPVRVTVRDGLDAQASNCWASHRPRSATPRPPRCGGGGTN